MKQQFDAWAAGFLDGEGCFSIKRRSPSARCRSSVVHHIQVDASQVDIRPLLALRAEYGGFIYNHLHGQNNNAAPAYRWKVTGPHAANLIRRVRPFLRVKDAHADALLALQQRLRRPDEPRSIVTRQEIAARDKLFKLVKTLNLKGRERRQVSPIQIEMSRPLLSEQAQTAEEEVTYA